MLWELEREPGAYASHSQRPASKRAVGAPSDQLTTATNAFMLSGCGIKNINNLTSAQVQFAAK